MAQILITNYTGDVASDIIVCSANTASIPPTIDYGFCTTLATQLTPNTVLPAYFTIDSAFDYDQYVYVQLSASTSLFTVPQLVDCSVVPPGTFGFEQCQAPLDKNIYVFYDTSGSYPDGINRTGPAYETLSGASQSIRNWFNDLVTLSGYTGQLYEIPVSNERYVNWACYPYLGSTTGGTLSDSSSVRIEMGYITEQSLVDPLGLGPAQTAIFTSPIVRRIALGQDLATGALLPASPGYSKGVPFDHATYANASNVQYGQFEGGDTNYVSIIVLNEACQGYSQDGCLWNSATSGTSQYIQPYFAWDNTTIGAAFTAIPNFGYPQPNPNNPVQNIYVPTYCDTYPSYTNPNYSGASLQRDYESWLKVWEDVNINLNGFTRAFLFPVPTSIVTAASPGGPKNQSQGFGTLYQAIELMEAEIPESSSYFQSQYCEGNLTGTQWPYPNARYNTYSAWTYNQGQYYDFSPLTYYNSFTVFTGTTAYQSLSSQYQVGPGLKNFGWKLDATITGFTQSLVTSNLNSYFASIFAGDRIYSLSEPAGANEGNVYTLQDYEGCWTYTGYRLDGQPQYSELSTMFEFDSCFECQSNINTETVAFKNTASRLSSNFIQVVSTQFDYECDIIGPPGATVDLNISWPYTSISGIPGAIIKMNFGAGSVVLTHGVDHGATVTLSSIGTFNLLWSVVSVDPSQVGWEYIKVEITGGTVANSGTFDNEDANDATIALGQYVNPIPTFFSINLSKVRNNANMSVVGAGSLQATSGAACSNFAYTDTYQIISTGAITPNSPITTILSNFGSGYYQLYDSSGINVVAGGNQWIALSNTYYTFDTYEPVKIAVQVNNSGVIINAALCP